MVIEPTNPDPETIGERLRRLRLERGLSQRELSEPGVSYAYISRIEAGARRPSVKALRMLARTLEVSADYLETGSEMRETDDRELRLVDAELELRLADDSAHAVELLEALLDEAERAGDSVCATRARVALGLAAIREGRTAEGVEQLEAALASGMVAPIARPDVYTTLGRAYAVLGSPDRAVRLFEQCLEEVTEESPRDRAAQVRFAAFLSYALGDLGEFERAGAVLRDALEHADEFIDPLTRVRLYRSLGRLAALEGKSSTALNYLRRAIALLEATEDTLQLARAYVSCAWTHSSLGRAEEAGPYLEAAESLFGSHADPIDLAYLRTEQARHAVNIGEADEAVARAQEALDLLREGDPAERGSAWSALAAGLALKKDADGAEDAFRKAADLLVEHGQRRDASSALRAWAKFLRANGREAEALDVLERATDLGSAHERAGTHVGR